MNTAEYVISNAYVVPGERLVKLPNVQLEKKEYDKVKKTLEKIGGKWKGGKTQGFVFNEDPTELLSSVQSGEKRDIKKEYQHFDTPMELARYVVDMSELDAGDNLSILEPSAGVGNLIRAINEKTNAVPDCYEIMKKNSDILLNSDLNLNLVGDDFLKNDGVKKYDRIIANPPFSKNQDIDHVYEMYNLLKDDGVLVSIMSSSWCHGSQKKQMQFTEWLVKNGAIIEPVKEGAFKSSGTNVSTVIIKIKK